MKFEKSGSVGAGLYVKRFAAKMKRATKKAAPPAPEPEEEKPKGIAPSLAGGMMAIRFAAKAKARQVPTPRAPNHRLIPRRASEEIAETCVNVDRLEEGKALRAKEGHNKRETVSVEKQVSLAKAVISAPPLQRDPYGRF